MQRPKPLPIHKGEVLRARAALAAAPDTRAIKREIKAGNRYVLAKLDRMGLVYDGGAIRRREDHDERR
jgi:hypothetical protein